VFLAFAHVWYDGIAIQQQGTEFVLLRMALLWILNLDLVYCLIQALGLMALQNTNDKQSLGARIHSLSKTVCVEKTFFGGGSSTSVGLTMT